MSFTPSEYKKSFTKELELCTCLYEAHITIFVHGTPCIHPQTGFYECCGPFKWSILGSDSVDCGEWHPEIDIGWVTAGGDTDPTALCLWRYSIMMMQSAEGCKCGSSRRDGFSSFALHGEAKTATDLGSVWQALIDPHKGVDEVQEELVKEAKKHGYCKRDKKTILEFCKKLKQGYQKPLCT